MGYKWLTGAVYQFLARKRGGAEKALRSGRSMGKQDDPEKDPRWMNTMLAVAGAIFVMTLLINFWTAASTLFD